MHSLPSQFSEAVFRHGCNYGFPEREHDAIKFDYPHVHIAWRLPNKKVSGLENGRMEVWAVGQTGKPHCLIHEVDNWMVYRLHEILHKMKYAAMNRSPENVYEQEKAELEARYDNLEEDAVNQTDHDRLNWQIRKEMGIHEDIVGQVPRNYGETVAEA